MSHYIEVEKAIEQEIDVTLAHVRSLFQLIIGGQTYGDVTTAAREAAADVLTDLVSIETTLMSIRTTTTSGKMFTRPQK